MLSQILAESRQLQKNSGEKRFWSSLCELIVVIEAASAVSHYKLNKQAKKKKKKVLVHFSPCCNYTLYIVYI